MAIGESKKGMKMSEQMKKEEKQKKIMEGIENLKAVDEEKNRK